MNEKGRALQREYANHPNVRKMIDFIGASEGADYNTGFGGRTISLDRHPNVAVSFGKGQKTTAAGKSQFLYKTWKPIADELGLTDFSPESQDVATIKLLQQSGALDDVVRGDFASAINKTKNIWASFPGSKYGQKTRSWEFVNNFFNGNLGTGKHSNNALAELVRQRIHDLGNEGFNIWSDDDISSQQMPIQQMARSAQTDSRSIIDALAGASMIDDAPSTEDMLFSANADEAAENARNSAVTQFISGGQKEAAFPLEVPTALNKEIRRIVADL